MKFSIVGTGNAAWHFSHILRSKGHELLQVYGRNREAAIEFGSEVVDDPSSLHRSNELVIIAVKDDAISEISRLIPPSIPTIHTSGATSIEVLVQQKKGVVWPVQTIKKNQETDHSNTPFLIEASDDAFGEMLMKLFSDVSSLARYATGIQRANAHMATVFANNFTTQLLDISAEILKANGLSLEIALPSLREVIHKLEELSPKEIQTGPARRADMETIQGHLALLKDLPEEKELYIKFTNRILRTFHGKEL